MNTTTKTKIKNQALFIYAIEGKGKEKRTSKEATTAKPQNAEVQRKSQEQGGEEETQSND